MSEKFKKHIIENLQPPFFYNLQNLFGLSYDEETYRYFICKYLCLDPEDYQIEDMEINGIHRYNTYEIKTYSEENYVRVDDEGNWEELDMSETIYYETITPEINGCVEYELWWKGYYKQEKIYMKNEKPPWLSNNPN